MKNTNELLMTSNNHSEECENSGSTDKNIKSTIKKLYSLKNETSSQKKENAYDSDSNKSSHRVLTHSSSKNNKTSNILESKINKLA
jgi:hypothetical protein